MTQGFGLNTISLQVCDGTNKGEYSSADNICSYFYTNDNTQSWEGNKQHYIHTSILRNVHVFRAGHACLLG